MIYPHSDHRATSRKPKGLLFGSLKAHFCGGGGGAKPPHLKSGDWGGARVAAPPTLPNMSVSGIPLNGHARQMRTL